MQSESFPNGFDFTLETEKMRQQTKSGLSLDESSRSSTNPVTSDPPGLRCACGAIELDSAEARNGSHTCSGSFLDHWQHGRIQFPLQKSGEKQYVGLILPRARPRSHCKDLLSTLLKSRNKIHAHSGTSGSSGSSLLGKSRLPLNVDATKFSPKTEPPGRSKRIKLDPVDLNPGGRRKTESETQLADGDRAKPKSQSSTVELGGPKDGEEEEKERPQNHSIPDPDDLCPNFRLIPEYLGIEGEPFIQTARRGFVLFKQEFGVDVFDPTPGAGRERFRKFGGYLDPGTYPTPPMEDKVKDKMLQYLQKSVNRHWTPFNSVDILPRVMQTLQMDFQRTVQEMNSQTPAQEINFQRTAQEIEYESRPAEEGTESERSCAVAAIIRLEKCAQTETKELQTDSCTHICNRCWKRPTASDVGVGTHTADEGKGQDPDTGVPSEKPIGSKLEKDVTAAPSTPRSQFTLPIPTPPPPPRSTPSAPLIICSSTNLTSSCSYSSHFFNSKSSLARPAAAIVPPPSFASLETFPPLSTTAPTTNSHNQEHVRHSPSSVSSSAPIPVSSKPRIPSLMDLKITLPANPSNTNAAAILITKRRGKPRLPTIADAIQHSMLKSSSSRSSKLSNTNIKKAPPISGTAAAELKAICLRDDIIEADVSRDSDEGFPSLVELGIDLQQEQEAWRILEEQEEIRRNEKLLYSWPLEDKPEPEPETTLKVDVSISSDDSPVNCPWTANSVSMDSPNSSTLDIEDSNNNSMTPLTPRILKIGKESQYPQHRGTNSLFHLLVRSSKQPPIQNVVAQEVQLEPFIQSWKETRDSMICLDGEGQVEFKRFSSIQN